MSDLRDAGRKWAKAHNVERAARDKTYAEIRKAVDGGMSQSEAARVAGVDRMTVRKALGLR